MSKYDNKFSDSSDTHLSPTSSVDQQFINQLANPNTTEELSFYGQELSSIALKTLIRELKSCQNLETLNLGGNPEVVKELVSLTTQCSSLAHLKSLSLMANDLTDEAMPAICKMICRSDSLQSLHLGYNHLSNRSLERLASALAENFSLTQIHFRNNSGVSAAADPHISRIKFYLKRNKKIASISQDLSCLITSGKQLLDDINIINSSELPKQRLKYLRLAFHDLGNQLRFGLKELYAKDYPAAPEIAQQWQAVSEQAEALFDKFIDPISGLASTGKTMTILYGRNPRQEQPTENQNPRYRLE